MEWRTALFAWSRALAGVSASVACTAACSAADGTSVLPRPDPLAAASFADAVGTTTQPRRVITASEQIITDTSGRCPQGMVDIEGAYCIDKYEASLVEVMPGGEERPYSPFLTAEGRRVRAVSEPNVHPQGYISAVYAQRACAASGKRLCRAQEWIKACRGPDRVAYGYSDVRQPGRCNDRGRNPVLTLFGRRWTNATLNQPTLNQLEGTLARTGEHAGCTNGYGVYDMVGNLHEWVADGRGAFQGGYYLDVASVGHGEGCGYVTTAHAPRYHDYSTGFRCCADPIADGERSPRARRR